MKWMGCASTATMSWDRCTTPPRHFKLSKLHTTPFRSGAWHHICHVDILVLGPTQYAFGPRTGLWVVVPFQVIVMVGEHGDCYVARTGRRDSDC